jgi:hypothetical protein
MAIAMESYVSEWEETRQRRLTGVGTLSAKGDLSGYGASDQ